MGKPRFASGICIIGVLMGCSHVETRAPSSSGSADRSPSRADRIGDMPVTAAPDSAKVFANAGYHFTMAQAYSADGESDRAIEEYKLALVYDPDSSIVYSRLTNEYLRKGVLSSAMETCKEGLAKHPDFTDLRMLLAGLLSTNRQFAEAIRQYESVLKSEPANEEAAVFKAQTHLELDDSELAKTTLTKLLARSPDSALAWYYLGRVEQVQRHVAAAETNYKKAMKLRTGFVQAQLSLAFLYEEDNRSDAAVKIYSGLFEQSQDLTAANRLVTIFLKNEQFKEALPYLESLENLDPDDLNAQVKLGLVYMELKQLDRAERTFTTILAKNPDSDRISFYLGNLYEETKRDALAIERFGKIIPASKLYTDGVLHIAQIRRNAGQLSEAADGLEKAIAASPKTLSFYVYQASLFEEETKLPEAIVALERAYTIFPDDEKVLYYLANLYDRVGQVDKGIAKMEQLLFLNPKNPDALNYLGYTWTTLGKNLDQAELLLKRALEIAPKNAFVLDSWGFHLYTRGKVAKAIPYMEKAVQIKGDESIMFEHLADAYARLNLPEKALATYLRASSVAKEDAAKQSVAKKIDSIRAQLAQTGKSQNGRRPASISVNKVGE